MQNNATYRMYENGIDQLFGSRLENHQVPNAGGDWDDLEKKLDARDKQRKKPAYTKWLLALLLLGGMTAGVIAITGSGGKKEQYAQQEQAATVPGQGGNKTTENTGGNNPSAQPQQQPGVAGNETVNGNDNINTNNNTNNNTYSPYTTNNSGTPVKDIVNNVAPASNGSNGNPANRTTPSKVKTQPSTFSGYDRGIASTPVKNTNRNGITRRQPASLLAKNSGTVHPVEYSSPEDDQIVVGEATVPDLPVAAGNTPLVPNSEETKTGAASNTEINGHEAVKTTEDKKPGDKTAAPAVNEQSGNGAQLAANAQALPVTKAKRTRTRKEAPEHEYISGMQGKWYVEAFSGYNNSIKQNKSFAAFLAPAGYVEKRLNQENALVSLQAGVNVRYRRNHLIFGTGLSYLELGDMVKYDASYTGPVALNANGRSKLTYIEVPVSAGYDWANKRWGFSLMGGISAGVLVGAKGQYVSLNSFNNDLFDLNANKSTFRKTQFNLLLTPSVNYFMNEHTNIFVSPLYRLNLQPVTVPGASINQKYYGMGLRVGIRTTLR